jgi:hypothetical protein
LDVHPLSDRADLFVELLHAIMDMEGLVDPVVVGSGLAGHLELEFSFEHL